MKFRLNAERTQKGANVNLDQAVNKACEEKTLVEALTWIAVWETERVIKRVREYDKTGISTASDGKCWDTCFTLCFKKTMEKWNEKPEFKMKTEKIKKQLTS